MTEPTRPRPVPEPPRPGPGPAGSPAPGARDDPSPVRGAAGGQDRVPAAEPAPADVPARFAGLEARPVADHVAVFEEEHARLLRELGTIDQL